MSRPFRLLLLLCICIASVASLCAAACTEAPPNATPTDPCEKLTRCCEALSGPVGSQCRSTLDAHRGQAGATDACRNALATFEQSGQCAPSGIGGGDGGTSDASGSSRAICDAYIACVGSTTPEELGVIAATYGPNGSCWSAATEALCLDACRTGLRNARLVHDDEKACPECLASADCEGSPNGPACNARAGRCVKCTSDATCGGRTPACDTAKNECVECNDNAHCKAGVCDTDRHRCVRCVSDYDCAAPTPRCKRAPNGDSICVACRTGADCGTGVCDNGACCQPESCDELKQIWGIRQATSICGTTYSTRCSGANVSCGGCTRGACTQGGTLGRCSLENTPCTPGTPGACLADEVCAYVPNKRGYFCSYDIRGTTCVYGGGPECNDYHFACVGANMVQNGTCQSYCLNNADCASGQTCGIYPELGYGICTP